MSKTYILPEKNRIKLQEIWGTPLLGNEQEVLLQYNEFLKDKKYKLIITIGDYCSRHLNSDIKIFDGFVQRQQYEKTHAHTLNFKNPAGTIQQEAWDVIKEAIKNKENVCVDGEEDLIVIPAVILAPKNSLIAYGLPNKGVCLLESSFKNKLIFRAALKKYFSATKTK